MSKLTPPKIDRNMELVSLYQQGWTYMELAKKYNISYTRARDIREANKNKLKYERKHTKKRRKKTRT